MTDVKNALDNLDQFTFFKDDPPGSLIFSDIDGTLSNISQTPGGAVVDESVREALRMVSASYRLILVTGRPLIEAREMVGIDGLSYLANHGLDYFIDGKYSKTESREDRDGIEKAVSELTSTGLLSDGVTCEDKGLALAVHYRLARDKKSSKEALMRILAPLARRNDMTLIEGRMVVELKSKKSDKGIAVLKTIKSFGASNTLYIGDDTTDVDAFRAISELGKSSGLKGVSIGVLSSETPKKVIDESDFVLPSVDGVERFLRWLPPA